MGSGDALVDKIIDRNYQQVTCPVALPYNVTTQCFISQKSYRSGTITFKNTFLDECRLVKALYNLPGSKGPYDPNKPLNKLLFDEKSIKPEPLLNAAYHVAVDMKVDLASFFGIGSTVMQTSSSVTVSVSMNVEEEKNRCKPIVDRIKASKLSSESDADVSDRINRWMTARERLMEMFNTGMVVKLATYGKTETRSRSLAFACKEPFGDYLLNPFTWRTPDGTRTLITDACRDHGKGPFYGRAAICVSATAILIHEIGHVDGCMIFEKEKCVGHSGIALGDMPAPPYENDNAKDLDSSLGAHPDIAKRVQGLGKPGRRTYLDFDVRDEDLYNKDGLYNTPEPNHAYFELPDEGVLRTGELDSSLLPKTNEDQEIMKFIEGIQDKSMLVLLDKFSKVRAADKGYDRLLKMRDWYTSDHNSDKEKWKSRPRLAMDKILHRDEDPTPDWLMGALDRARQCNELKDDDYEPIRNKYVQQPPPEENGTGARVNE